MLIIRLQRTGKKNQADFRIVLAEKTAPVNKKIAEVLGSYNPRSKKFQVKEDRVKYWTSQHVQVSPTVHNLFVWKGLIEALKTKAFRIPKKPVVEVVQDKNLAPSPDSPEIATKPEAEQA